MKKTVYVIGGPTASGKSALAIALAKKIDGEIISADSMQIYKDMNIGTAKVTQEEMQGIKHYMIDFVSPETRYSVSNFKKDAENAIEEIIEHGKTPIIVGGTGLYIDSLIYGIEFQDEEIDTEYREKLNEIAEKDGLETLFEEACKIDPEAMKKISINDKKRIIRVLEIFNKTGKTKTQVEIESRKNKPKYNYKMYAITMDREKLYNRIEKRVDKMIEEGLIEEVQNILNKYANMPTAMQGLGYKEVVEYLENKVTRDEMIEKIKKETRHYAKRQLTWFRKNKETVWLDGEKTAEENIRIILKIRKDLKMKKTVKKEKRNVNKIRKNVIQVIIISLIIFAIIFTVYQIIRLAIHPTESFMIEQGIISQTESLIGYVIRDEKVIKSEENTEKLVQIKNEGERVSVGETVFRYEAEGEQETNEKIQALNMEIQTAMEGQTELFPSDIKAIEKQIENKIDGINNNIQDIRETKTDINNYITKKAKIAGELSPAGSYINNLINDRIALENKLKNSSKYKNAPMSGIISYRVDGLEEVLLPTELDNISIKMLENFNLITGQIVSTSDIQGKIINNFECYIAVITDSNESKKATVGDKIKIRIASGQLIPATIENIKQDGNKNLVIFKITQGVEYLISYRKISLDIIWWEEDGLRVPNTSIIFENGLSYVIRKKTGVLSKILVKIVKENEKYSIITNYKTDELKNMGYSIQEINNMKKISIYDEIITDPDIDKIEKELK